MAKQMGEIFLDHRASPGLPEDVARASGYDPQLCKEGKLFEAATLHCSHCGIHVVKNPLRTRDRPHCWTCNHYVCDPCHAVMQHADYVHTPFDRFADLTRKGELVIQPSPLGLLCTR
jgi:hypothetical protein